MRWRTYAHIQLCRELLLTIPQMNQEACRFDDKEAVTFPAETDMSHDISIIDVCSIIPRSVPESVQEHLIVTSNLKVKC